MIGRYAVKTDSGVVYYGFYDTVPDFLHPKLFDSVEYIIAQLEDVKNNRGLINKYCCHSSECNPVEAVVGYLDDTIPGVNFEHNGHKVYICENCKCVLDGLDIFEAEEAQGVDRYTDD